MTGFHFEEHNGVRTLHCDALDELGFVNHAFTTRLGGNSEGYLSAMNLSFSREARETVEQNYDILSRAEGFCKQRFTLTDQVHTDKIRIVGEAEAGMGMSKPTDIIGTDGLVTDLPETPLIAFIADCGGILLADRKHKAVSAVHSGWRGTLAQITQKALAAMRTAYGTDPKDIVAAIGPSIGPCCYEVGSEVRDEFIKAWQTDVMFTAGDNGKYLLDLWLANRMVLELAGVPAEQIFCCEECTMCHSDLYYSHRATQGKRGNLGAIIEIRRT